MVKILGIEFAPLSVPWERRLQTAAAIKWTHCFLFLGFGCLFLSIGLLFTRFYFIPLLYLPWYIYDHYICNTPERGGRVVPYFRNWLPWQYLVKYFPIKLIKTVDLDPKKNYLFGCHPHGIMCAGAFGNFATDVTGFPKLFPGLRPILLVLAGQFSFPFYRDYFMTSGSCSVSKDSIRFLLKKEGGGNALALIVGGAVEALEARPGSYTLKLKDRKGFIKLAMENGASVVPVFSFGENDIYTQVPNPEGSFVRNVQNWMTKRLGFSVPLFHGRGIFNYTFGLIPFRHPINTVVGAPIDIEKNTNPTKEQIDKFIRNM